MEGFPQHSNSGLGDVGDSRASQNSFHAKGRGRPGVSVLKKKKKAEEISFLVIFFSLEKPLCGFKQLKTLEQTCLPVPSVNAARENVRVCDSGGPSAATERAGDARGPFGSAQSLPALGLGRSPGRSLLLRPPHPHLSGRAGSAEQRAARPALSLMPCPRR